MTTLRQKLSNVIQNRDTFNDEEDRILAERIALLLKPKNDNNLVIVANKGIHAIDECKLPGSVFYASQGNLGGEPMTPDTLKSDLEDIIRRVARKLKEQHYDNVYVVPTGFPIISQYIVAVVIQVIAKPPTILQYDRNSNEYWPFDLSVRKIISES